LYYIPNPEKDIENLDIEKEKRWIHEYFSTMKMIKEPERLGKNS